MNRHQAGRIVVVDWRGGALPHEPGKLRPAVVVEDHELLPDDYPNVLVVPLTRDERLARRSFAERIEPTPISEPAMRAPRDPRRASPM